MIVASHRPLPVDAALQVGEANALAAAELSVAVTKLSARFLVIKGISLSARGLRPNHSSADLDLLLDPRTFEEIVAVANSIGWRRRPASVVDSRLSVHSVSMSRLNWPNDIDLHAEFPGLLVGPNRAFEVLWRNREALTIAGQSCWVPDRLSSIVIWALHSLRGSASQSRHADELRQLVELVLPRLSKAESKELADRIVELGADEPLRVVPEFAEIIGNRRGPQLADVREAWLKKVAVAQGVSPWHMAIHDARPGERPWLLFRAAWPSADDLRLSDEHLVDTPLGRVQSRGRRAWRLVERIVERRRQAR